MQSGIKHSGISQSVIKQSEMKRNAMKMSSIKPGSIRRMAAVLLPLFTLLCLIGALLTGCSGEAPAAAAAPGAPAPAPVSPGEEERLVIYTSHKEEVWWPIIKEFEARTGIWVQVETGGTNELLSRIEEEKDSPVADVMFGGGVESLAACGDLFQPYKASGIEAVLPEYLSPDSLYTPFSALPIVMVRNNRLVEPDQLKAFSDLFRQEFRGRIAFADPQSSASSYTALVTMQQALGEEDTDRFLESFAAQLDGKQLSSSGEVLTATAEGRFAVGVTLEETALKQVSDGGALSLVYPEDGTSAVPDGSAVVKNAPHAANARRFLDFTLDPDVQTLLPVRFSRRPVRTDIDEAALSGGALPQLSALHILPYDTERASGNRKAILMSWAFYFGGEP